MFFGVRSIYLAPKNFIFFLQWYFTFRGSVVIKAAHRRKFSISASALPSFGRLPHSRREIFPFLRGLFPTSHNGSSYVAALATVRPRQHNGYYAVERQTVGGADGPDGAERNVETDRLFTRVYARARARPRL